jgi:AcrR family transcriptional regulator
MFTIIMSSISILINERFYSKDPRSSDLGRKIVAKGLSLIDELGYEQFTFRKLAESIGSTEASIYRYFENKQKLLIYLTTWYWAWAEFKIDYDTHHLSDDWQKLTRIWEILCHVDIGSSDSLDMDIESLRNLVVSESDKIYLTKHVDEINKEGLFKGFKSLCHKIALIVQNLDPDYAHPHTLVSSMMEAAHQQYYFANHLPSLTEVKKDNPIAVNIQVKDFILQVMEKQLDTIPQNI